ncbi:alpha/beta fold hydrolase [Nonomuraea sp. SYSU D8015]|uniref:alpha/beta fold hydrolase n=1 Tax=Nonomuraea sp. SYSU D8015 TaxID=2593644 RepID=UPI001660B22E|nr:alpha/beta hydrolase [Nonomuraea sp. SYSU D8015]
METVEATVRSADGTEIAYERSGSGPALVMIDPAGGYSGFDNIRGLGALLAEWFTVHTYDRRGRGRSGDTPPYAVGREIGDLAAVIAAAGGSALVYGFSSGALLALHAAAAGLPIEKLALFEPPVRAENEPPDTAFAAEIAALVSSGRRADAVDRFLTAVGVPPEMLTEPMPGLEAVAHTFVYDLEISIATTYDLLRSVRTPTLVLDSQGSTDFLTEGTAALVTALPNGTGRSLPGGWHGVPDKDLAPVVADFFRGRGTP